MFKNLELLNRKKHAKLKLKPVDGFKFAEKATYSLLGGSEVGEASKSFPIVFPAKSDDERPLLPLALLSLNQEENYFVGDDGAWKADYVPNHFQRYPFIFSEVSGKKNQFVLMIDADAPQLNETEGADLFDTDGEPQEIVKRVKEMLGRFQADIVRTHNILADLEEKDVLVPKQFNITRGDKKTAVRGFRVVDIKKVNGLDDETLVKWVRNGLMGIIYAHVNSLTNLKKVAAAQGAVEKK